MWFYGFLKRDGEKQRWGVGVRYKAGNEWKMSFIEYGLMLNYERDINSVNLRSKTLSKSMER